MRLTLAIAATLIAGLVVLPQAVQAQDRPPAYTNAEACLRERVADAVAASSGAADAADFLLNYLCAQAVGYAANYEQNSVALNAFRSVTAMEDAEAGDLYGLEDSEDVMPPEDPFADMYIDPVTGEFGFASGNEESAAMMPFLSGLMGMQGAQAGSRPPLFLRVLAGELVLQQRR